MSTALVAVAVEFATSCPALWGDCDGNCAACTGQTLRRLVAGNSSWICSWKSFTFVKNLFHLVCQSQVKRNFALGSKDRRGLMRSRPDPCWDFGLLNLNLLITMGQVRSPLAIMHIESILLTQYQNSVSNYTINNSPKHDRYSQGGDPPDRAMCIHWSSESDFCYAGRGPWNMSTRDGHADADIRINIRIIRIYCAISDTCRIMRIYLHRCASANISAWPSLMSMRQLESGVGFSSHCIKKHLLCEAADWR